MHYLTRLSEANVIDEIHQYYGKIVLKRSNCYMPENGQRREGLLSFWAGKSMPESYGERKRAHDPLESIWL